MKNRLQLFIFFLLTSGAAFSQIMPITIEPYGGNKRAGVSEQIGVAKIDISYNRPGVKGREGKIWGTSVAHYGFVDLGHGTTHAAPWRAGANENTTMSFSQPVMIEGQNLPAGKYGFFIALGETESTLIFNKISNSWGSFYYDETEDALRVTVKNQTLDKSVEWLKYEFLNEGDSSATIALSWEKRMIPFTVSINRKALQVAAFKSDFRTTRSYDQFLEAVYWCVRNNYDLNQALAWVDRAIYFRVMGSKNFTSLSAKALVLTAMKRDDEAKKIMDEALPLGNMTEIHFYGRQLLSSKKTQDAFKVFKMNYDKYPNEYTTNVGMGRVYSAMGDFKKAGTYMKTAAAKAPDDGTRTNAENMAKLLAEGKDVN